MKKGKYDFASELIDFANNNGISNLNLLDYYINIEGLNKNSVSEYYWKIDGHHNSKGYELFANGVIWELEKIYSLEQNDSIEIR